VKEAKTAEKEEENKKTRTETSASRRDHRERDRRKKECPRGAPLNETGDPDVLTKGDCDGDAADAADGDAADAVADTTAPANGESGDCAVANLLFRSFVDPVAEGAWIFCVDRLPSAWCTRGR
jgi:hypothetical protein